MRPSEWIFVALLAAVFAPALIGMAQVWSTVDYYSHGYLVPWVALWAASAQRHRLRTLPAERDPRGALVLAAAVGALLVGLAAGSAFVAGLSAVAAVAGGVLHLRGAAWLRALAFGISYLLFMVPIPSDWLTPLIVRLQLFVSATGVALLQAMGQPVLRDGNVILLPGGGSLFVAEACSGITSLVTLLPLGVLLAWFSERSTGRRLLLVATVVPAALLGNLARVVGTVLAAGRFGVEAATESALHDWAGIFTYVLACGLLLGVGALLRRFWPAPA